jgi:hypothetical protein
MLCETGWQQAMGGEGRYKHSMERRSRTLQDEYKKGSSRAKKDRFVGFIETIVRCVEWGACRDR